MSLERLPESELILNSDGSVYHLHIKDEHVADTVILVGDQGRVQQVSSHFDSVDHRIQNREFITHTGFYKNKRLTVLSTGIGTDNIDIAVNELDAAVNIDPVTRTIKTERRKLNLIRIGTSGALQADIPVGSHIVSEFGLGFDGLIYFYNHSPLPEEKELAEKINTHLAWNSNLSVPYVIKGSVQLLETIGKGMLKGITATASGFYGPQGRRLRLVPKNTNINSQLQSFSYQNKRIVNFEMETSALYGLGKLLGHECCTCCVIIANRIRQEYSINAHQEIDKLIETVLKRVVNG